MSTLNPLRPALLGALLGALVTSLPATAQPIQGQAGDVTFVNGGITSTEADRMRAEAPRYPLEVVVAQRGPLGHNDFLAGVDLRVTDSSGRTVLDRPDAGPIFLADLPDGDYTVEATSNGRTQSRHVRIAGGAHEKVAFLWQ